MDQKLLPILKIFIITTTVITFVFSIFAAGYWYGAQIQIEAKGSYQEGWQAAKEKLEQSGLLPPEPEEIFVLSGKITKISENHIFFRANQVVINPLETPAPEERIAIISPQTKIIQLIPKAPEELAREEAAFLQAMEKLKPNAPLPEPPSPEKEKEIGLTEIKEGDTIRVTADQNIKFAEKFEVKEIHVIPTTTPSTPLSP